MTGKAPPASITKLTAKPHSWSAAAKYVTAPKGAVLAWLRESGLPGTGAITKGTWPPKDRERFLRFFCGELG